MSMPQGIFSGLGKPAAPVRRRKPPSRRPDRSGPPIHPRLQKGSWQEGIPFLSAFAASEARGRGGCQSASKFGLRALTQSLLSEGAPFGVKAFAICPGYVATPMAAGSPIPPEEMIQPEDVARVVMAHLSLSGATVLKDIVISRLGAEL